MGFAALLSQPLLLSRALSPVMQELLQEAPERAPSQKKGKGVMTSAGDDGADTGVAPGDDEASSLPVERASQATAKGGHGPSDRASQGEARDVERDLNPVGSGGGSSGQELEVPLFRQPRHDTEPPLALVILVVVPPPSGRRPVEPPLYVLARLPFCLAILRPLTGVLLPS